MRGGGGEGVDGCGEGEKTGRRAKEGWGGIKRVVLRNVEDMNGSWTGFLRDRFVVHVYIS